MISFSAALPLASPSTLGSSPRFAVRSFSFNRLFFWRNSMMRSKISSLGEDFFCFFRGGGCILFVLCFAPPSFSFSFFLLQFLLFSAVSFPLLELQRCGVFGPRAWIDTPSSHRPFSFQERLACPTDECIFLFLRPRPVVEATVSLWNSTRLLFALYLFHVRFTDRFNCHGLDFGIFVSGAK